MKTAVIGGTFDPVHLGHMHLLHSLVELTDYERVLLIPVANPPHKKQETSVTTEHRVTMLHLAFDQYYEYYPTDREVEIVIELCEIERGGTSFMFDTVSDLYQRYMIDGKIAMVIGDDLLSGLRRWYRFEELRHDVEFIICRRAQIRPAQVLPPGVVGRFLENPVMEDSSTAIRELLASGEATSEKLTSLVPSSVVQYIQDYGLYRN